MINEGSIVVIRTNDAIYSTCKIIAINDNNVTVTYFAGMKKDRITKKYCRNHQIETISRKKIVSMSERL